MACRSTDFPLKNLQENRIALHALRLDIQEYLESYRGACILYLPNPGNGGDSLIAAATFQAFARAGIACIAIDLDADVEGEVVFLGGGGNLIPLYDNIRTAYERFLGRARRIVLLPHTVRGNDELLGKLDGSCTLFVRDTASHAHVRSVSPSLDVRLAHDMAFHLDTMEFLEDEALIGPGTELLKAKLSSVGVSIEALQAWPSVDMLRLDRESSVDVPVSDVDISDLFMLGVGPHDAPLAAWCFLKSITYARHINTDRLHVGIGSALLGVPCTLRDNSYGKNAAVFWHSLQEFSNVRLVAGAPKNGPNLMPVANAKELSAELEEARAELSRSAEMASRGDRENDRLKADLTGCRRDLVELRAMLVGAEMKVAGLQQKIDCSDAEIKDLESKLDAASREVVGQQQKLKATTTEHAVLLARCDALTSANATLRTMLARNESAQGEVVRLGGMHAALAAEHAEQGELFKAARAELALLRLQVAAEQERVKGLLASTSWRITQPLRWLRQKR